MNLLYINRYSLQGRELVRKNLDRLLQFKWRPRPPVKLQEQKLKEIRKNLKTTSVKFDREDNDEKVKASQEVSDRRTTVGRERDVGGVYWMITGHRQTSQDHECIRCRETQKC